MTKRGIIYLIFSILGLALCILGCCLCADARADYAYQIAQVTSGLDITPVFWTTNRIWGIITGFGGLIGWLAFGVATLFVEDCF